MRKHLSQIILGLLFWLLASPIAMAGVTEWQIQWQEDGTLQESVIVSGQPMQNLDASWQRKSEGTQQIYSRTIKSWEDYSRLKDKLPLNIHESNYIFCKATEISSSSQVEEDGLYASLQNTESMNLKINVPGAIQASSAEKTSNNTATWHIKNAGTAFSPSFNLKALTVDGLMLGICILTIGVVVMFIFFVVRMRRVDRIIAETYSLDNVKIEEDEGDLV